MRNLWHHPFTGGQLRWPSGFRYTDPTEEYAKAKAKPGAKAVGKLGVPKVPVKVKGGSLPPMNIGKAPAVKGGVKYAGPPKAKVSWCSLLRKKQPWNQPFFSEDLSLFEPIWGIPVAEFLDAVCWETKIHGTNFFFRKIWACLSPFRNFESLVFKISSHPLIYALTYYRNTQNLDRIHVFTVPLCPDWIHLQHNFLWKGSLGWKGSWARQNGFNFETFWTPFTPRTPLKGNFLLPIFEPFEAFEGFAINWNQNQLSWLGYSLKSNFIWIDVPQPHRLRWRKLRRARQQRSPAGGASGRWTRGTLRATVSSNRCQLDSYFVASKHYVVICCVSREEVHDLKCALKRSKLVSSWAKFIICYFVGGSSWHRPVEPSVGLAATHCSGIFHVGPAFSDFRRTWFPTCVLVCLHGLPAVRPITIVTQQRIGQGYVKFVYVYSLYNWALFTMLETT